MIGNAKTIIEWLFEQDTTKKFEIYEPIGHGVINNKEFTHYKVYKGSSEMNSKEFSILLDGLVSECNEQSIATLTKSEREQLHFIEGCD